MLVGATFQSEILQSLTKPSPVFDPAFVKGLALCVDSLALDDVRLVLCLEYDKVRVPGSVPGDLEGELSGAERGAPPLPG